MVSYKLITHHFVHRYHKYVPHIANRLRWKSFVVCKTKLYFAGKNLWLDDSLVWPKPIAQAISLESFVVIY